MDRGSWSWIIGEDSGRIVMVNSSLRSDAPKRALGLVDSAEALIRGCTGANITIAAPSDVADGRVKLGVVNSSFVPPLDLDVTCGEGLCIKAPGSCGLRIAGQRDPVCDPRAACTLNPTGGVTCECIGPGIRTRDGSAADGSACFQESSLSSSLSSSHLTVTVKKPGFTDPEKPLGFSFRAVGETELTAVIAVSMTWAAAQQTRVWKAVDGQALSLLGHQLVWHGMAPNETQIHLDKEKQKFSDGAEYKFHILVNTTGINCTKGEPCLADGDMVETTLTVDTNDRSSTLSTIVRIQTIVESLFSCDNSQAWVEGDPQTVVVSSSLRVHVRAYDVDNLPICKRVGGGGYQLLNTPRVQVRIACPSTSPSGGLELTLRHRLSSNELRHRTSTLPTCLQI
jgi:hypothetical protein